MSVLVISKPPGVPLEMYDNVNKQLGIGSDPPAGLISHAAYARGDTFEVVEVWESAQDHDDFVENRLGPTIREAVGEEAYAQMPDAEREVIELHNLIVP
jgi:hypothetical protein